MNGRQLKGVISSCVNRETIDSSCCFLRKRKVTKNGWEGEGEEEERRRKDELGVTRARFHALMTNIGVNRGPLKLWHKERKSISTVSVRKGKIDDKGTRDA